MAIAFAAPSSLVVASRVIFSRLPPRPKVGANVVCPRPMADVRRLGAAVPKVKPP